MLCAEMSRKNVLINKWKLLIEIYFERKADNDENENRRMNEKRWDEKKFKFNV